MLLHRGGEIAVVGNGAVGVALASRLQLLGHQVVFLGRRALDAQNIRFEGWGKSFWHKVQTIQETEMKDLKLVFIAVKAYDLDGALRRYLPYLSKGCTIIPVGNGSVEGVIKDVSGNFPQFLWRLGYCTFGVSETSSSNFSLKTKVGKALWGPFFREDKWKDQKTELEKEILDKDQQNFFEWLDPIFPHSRKKWLYNVVMNSLSATNELESNGFLLNHMDEMKTVFDEAYDLGVELFGAWDLEKQKMFEEMIGLISATSSNENSMARDIKLGRKPETSYLAGMASGRPNYPKLNQIHEEILNKYNPATNSKRSKKN